ncbi:MAG: sodium:solute symporter [Gemmatimonadota bacterium]
MHATFTSIDWMMLILPTIALLYIGWKVQRYVLVVSDFMSGGRVAGRYLLTVADGTAGMGLVSVVALFEQWYKSGFAIGFWAAVGTPIGLIMGLVGFVSYRFRETRAMTLAQFFEMRYSKPVRVLAGSLVYLSGLINYAIFPAVGGRFFVHYCHLPLTVSFLGLELSTYGLTMACFLSVALTIVMLGGQITTMVTDCVQGIFMYLIYTTLFVSVIYFFSFSQFERAMLSRPPGESFVNPFDTDKLTDFNILYIMIGIFIGIYCRQAWQGNQGYFTAAATPHEQKMAGVLGSWRGGFITLSFSLLAVSAYTFMNHPDFSARAQEVTAELAERINFENPTTTETIRTQMLVPVALRHILPIGITGMFCAGMLFLAVSTDTTYLHSWGSIFIQDVVLPLKKKPFTPRRQIWALRLSILFVAVFAWFFSMLFSQTTYILMFFQLTGAVMFSWAGSLILGGLYWKRGTSQAAMATIIVGATLAIFGFLAERYWPEAIYPWLAVHAPGFLAWFKTSLEGLGDALPIAKWHVTQKSFPISGQEVALITALASITVYVTVSLLTCREPFNMDRMLHRGAYRREDAGAKPAPAPSRIAQWKRKLLGFDEQYTRGDRWIAWSVFLWSMFNFALFIVAAGYNLFFGRWSSLAWFEWWKWTSVYMAAVVGAVTTVWFSWGGVRDLRRLFKRLTTLQRNVLDDGRVIGHVSADDVARVEKIEHRTIEAAHQAEDALKQAMAEEKKDGDGEAA